MLFLFMPIARNKREAKRIAAEQLAKEMRLERGFLIDLRKFFKNYGKELRKHLNKTGAILDPDIFLEDFTKLLNKNYTRYSNAFKRNLRDTEEKNLLLNLVYKQNAQEINESINARIIRENQERAAVAAGLVLSTLRKDVDSEFGRLTEAARQEGISTTPEEFSRKLDRYVSQGATPRSQRISETEGGYASGNSMTIEAEELAAAGAMAAGVAAVLLKKTWVTTLDSRTRSDHVRADGQQVALNEAFSVGGERLPKPRDSSLGASAGNVINCRCQLVMSI